jgi:hypothetical protein
VDGQLTPPSGRAGAEGQIEMTLALAGALQTATARAAPPRSKQPQAEGKLRPPERPPEA